MLTNGENEILALEVRVETVRWGGDSDSNVNQEIGSFSVPYLARKVDWGGSLAARPAM